jgi:hypothetical protein
MHARILALAMTALAAACGGCSSMNNTEKGVGIGGALGAGTGLAIGAATGNPKTGAAVGGLLGAGIGGLAGSEKDRQVQERRDLQQANAVATAQAQAQQQRMGLTDVVHMCQQGHDEQVVINQIRSTGSTFQLSAADLDFLKTNSVPTRVIVEMQNAKGTPVVVQPSRPVVIREQPTVIYRDPPPVVIYERRPPPPPGMFIGYRSW